VNEQAARKRTFVLDTSALLALRGDETGAERVEVLLARAERKQCRLLISFMTRMELLYCIRREEGEAAAREALRLIDSFAVDWITCDREILEKAAEIKSTRRISLAESWIAATAIVHTAMLVHKNPEFESFKEIPQEMLK
jgi:predicted nucleic acid-binding protein